MQVDRGRAFARPAALDFALRAVQLLADFHRGRGSTRSGSGIFLSTSAEATASTSDLEPLIRGAGLTAAAALLEGLWRVSRMADGVVVEQPDLGPVADAVRSWRDAMRAAVQGDPALRRTWQLVDLVASSLQGMVVDSDSSPAGTGGSSTTSTTGSGSRSTVQHRRPWSHPSCAACTTSPSPTRAGTTAGPASRPDWVCSLPAGCSSTSRGRSSGG